MLKKKMKSKDFNGNEIEGTFYFHLSEAELAEMELSSKGGFVATMERIVEENDGAELVKIFKDLILNSYGKKSGDGQRFIKTEELKAEFSQTQFYSDLFMLLAQDADAAVEFVKGILPASMSDNITEEDIRDAKARLDNGRAPLGKK
jgi:hypothetical protein